MSSYGYSGLKRFIISLVEKYRPFDTRASYAAIGFITTILLGVVLILGWMSSKQVKEIVTKDFNEQQLMLARHAARIITNSLNTLKEELSLLSFSPSVQYFEKVSIGNRMKVTLESIEGNGAIEMRYVGFERLQTHLVDSTGYRVVEPDSDDMHYLRWSEKAKNKDKIMISEIQPASSGTGEYLQMRLAMPVWQVSVDESHPTAANRFAGVMIFVVDATSLIEKITNDIKSGKTGYAWAIDDEGTFLYHPETEFIGKNAFEARKEKEPTISFARINEIQKVMMMAGREGMSWYVSGWHRGQMGTMKKLIAYSPIRLESDESDHVWSVAVVAPVSEIEEAIHSVHVRQFSLQAIIIVAILLCGLTVVFMLHSWSHALESEVERKTSELKESEQRYKSLVENAEDMIFTVDRDGFYLSINKYGAGFFGKKPEDLMGCHISEVLPWSSAEVLIMMINKVFDRKESTQITHPVKVGSQERWFNTNLRRLFDKEGNMYAVLGISRDITERKKMEEQSFYTEKLASVGTLSAGVAHEINNPLGIILGFTDILLERAKPGTEEYDLLKTIEKHGMNAKRVVENLLSFSRYSDCKEENFNINENIDSVFSVIGNNLRLRTITLKREFSGNLPPVRGNPQEIQQVFFNIINNAIYAMKEGGALTVSTLAGNGNIEARFKDTGHGIKKEHLNRIFDPLFTTKKVGEGTGLGLSVSYGIVTKHGGTISVETKTEDEGEGHGTTFIVTLPANAHAG